MDRTVQPTHKIPQQLPEINPAEKILDNGNRVFVFKDENIEVVKLELLYDFGMANFQNPLTAKAAFDLLLHGTKEYNADDIAENLDA